MPLVNAEQLSLSYDANGNLVTGDGKYRVYNGLNQLWKIYNGTDSTGTLLEEFKYHPTEERVLIKKTYYLNGSLQSTTTYVSKDFVQVVNSSGTFNYTYIYANNELVAQINPNGSKYFMHKRPEGRCGCGDR